MPRGDAKKTGAGPPAVKPVASNRKAFHDYFIEDRAEAGLVLTGTEVKSLRAGRAQLKDAYVNFRDGEAYLVGAHISPYGAGSWTNHAPERDRKLLLHRRELDRSAGFVAHAFVRCRQDLPRRAPPRLRVAQLGMRNRGPVPREAVPQVRDQGVGLDGMAGIVLVERLDETSAPPPGPLRERPVEVPEDEPAQGSTVPSTATRSRGAERARRGGNTLPTERSEDRRARAQHRHAFCVDR